MKSSLVIVAALALCGTAFADNGSSQGQEKHGLMDTVKQDAHKIGSAFRKDMHSIARADKFRQEQAADQHGAASQASTSTMGAAPADHSTSTGRQSRMDAAYANWQRTRR